MALAHQSADEERAIVAAQSAEAEAELVREAVAIVRETRVHPKFRKGASVRAAIALVAIARRLSGPDAVRRAAVAALTTRVELRDDAETTLDTVLAGILDALKKK